MTTKLFSEDKQKKLFQWKDVRTYLVRTQYNELLQQILEKDAAYLSVIPRTAGDTFKTTSGSLPPNYYNPSLCLTLNKCQRSAAGSAAATGSATAAGSSNCQEDPNSLSTIPPRFYYEREKGIIEVLKPDGTVKQKFDSTINLDNQLSFASVIWLYNYERMGIFKILGALMDDYNYRGKLPISSKFESNPAEPTRMYSELMDTISTLYRLGIGSNLRDRITLYQRVLGVTIENSLNVESEKNESFMRHFNKLIGYMLDFFKDKRLAQAIRDTNTNSYRSSVATQTAIRDTILVLQKNFETFEYGRNRTNTFLGIATVFATICLLRMVKDEIGVPRQYSDPHEFIPAAYDILVMKRAVTSNETNRFTLYDNCASYGYRILADIELIEANLLTTVSIGSPLDAWLNDIEGNVEGYNNAFKSITETASSIV